MNEEVKRYVDPANRNLDIVLILVAIVLVAAFGIIYYMYQQNESTKVKFKINEFKDVTWVNELNEIKFTVSDDKVNLVIDSADVIKDATYELNKGTGEMIIDGEKGKLYIRAVSNNSLTIWYNYAEYHLEKEYKK
ncbi:MAG: hypothetical protein IJS56_04160 [Bacilli bacterium]|nr:hypothetical protein [Bacilli bacterium]